MQTELPSPHLRKRRDAGNLPGVGGIHRRYRLAQVHVVECIEQFGTELRIQLFRDGEPLGQRQIRVE